MHQLSKLEPTSNCPDPDCQVPIGVPHLPECEIATCLTTGEQRLLHQGDALAEMLNHDCGQDTWTGQLYGIAECQQYGWFVRRATETDPADATWVPCFPDHPGAVPDLDRLARQCVWDPAQRRWNRRTEVPGRG